MSRSNRPEDLGNHHNTRTSQNRYSNSRSSQRARILKHFKECPRLSTIQAREQYGIMSPAPRIKELRAQGYNIVTQRITEHDSNGVPHCMGLYVFQDKKQEVFYGN